MAAYVPGCNCTCGMLICTSSTLICTSGTLLPDSAGLQIFYGAEVAGMQL
jgi:hypothetical protein